jgi:hypothetical protein
MWEVLYPYHIVEFAAHSESRRRVVEGVAVLTWTWAVGKW